MTSRKASSISETANAGSGGTRLAHAIRCSMLTLGNRFISTLPTAQLTADAKVSTNATGGMLPLKVPPIITSPAKAISMPAICRPVGLSPR